MLKPSPKHLVAGTAGIAGGLALAFAITTLTGSAVAQVKTNSPGELVSILNSKATSEDAIPSDVSLDGIGDGGLDADSARVLGETDVARFWVGLDAKSNICVVVHLLGSKGGGSACTSEAIFNERGLYLAVNGGTDYTEAYFVADKYSAVDLPKGLKLVSPQLVVGDTRELTGEVEFSAPGDSKGSDAAVITQPLIHPPLD